MPARFATSAAIDPTEHTRAHFLGMDFNVDTIIGTLIAASVVVGLGLLVRARITAGVPGGPQLAFETALKAVRNHVEDRIGVHVAPYLLPIGLCLLLFILACNWISVLPLHVGSRALLEPPTADVNLTYALTVPLFVWWHWKGIRAHRGVGKHVMHVVKGRFPPFATFWIVQVFSDFFSLAWRLFGNMFSGGIIISLLAMVPGYVFWLPAAAWKLFEMGVGMLQAYLFTLLTIEYFNEATEIR